MKTKVIAMVIAAAAAAGCAGMRFSAPGLEKRTEQGVWRVDGALIRTYDISLAEAFDSIDQMCKENAWIITGRDLEPREAGVEAYTRNQNKIEFQIWAPPGRPTDIGIEVDGGEQDRSAEVFAALEPYLPGTRVVGNQ